MEGKEAVRRIERDGCGACAHAVYVSGADDGVRLFCPRCVRNHEILWEREVNVGVRGASAWALIVEVFLRAACVRRREKK